MIQDTAHPLLDSLVNVLMHNQDVVQPVTLDELVTVFGEAWIRAAVVRDPGISTEVQWIDCADRLPELTEGLGGERLSVIVLATDLISCHPCRLHHNGDWLRIGIGPSGLTHWAFPGVVYWAELPQVIG